MGIAMKHGRLADAAIMLDNQHIAVRQSPIGSIIEGLFDIRTPTEARNLATMLALACPDPGAVVVGLQELMLNSIEHCNLDIGGGR